MGCHSLAQRIDACQAARGLPDRLIPHVTLRLVILLSLSKVLGSHLILMSDGCLAGIRTLLLGRTIQHLWEACELIHTLDCYSCCLDCFSTPASRHNLIASLCKPLRPIGVCENPEPYLPYHAPHSGLCEEQPEAMVGLCTLVCYRQHVPT